MRYKYTAKILFENGDTLKKHGDKISSLLEWMQSESQNNFSDIHGEIIDNKLHRIIKNVQYSPLDEI